MSFVNDHHVTEAESTFWSLCQAADYENFFLCPFDTCHDLIELI